MKSPKLSARIRPKLDAFRPHSRIDPTRPNDRPITPSVPIGICSPLPRNDSATMAASAASVTHTIGTMAAKEESSISVLPPAKR